MIQRNSIGIFSAALATVALAAASLAQTAQPSKKLAETAPKPRAASPVSMTECEGTNNCATWTFLGSQGNGQWPSGDMANLTVENFDADTVVIRRADSTGNSAGLTAVYKGTRHGDRIGGEFTSSWPGHWEDKAGNWYATIGRPPQALPRLMHACLRCSPGYGSTWVWENDHYTNVAAPAGITEVLTVESFTRESVILHMTRSGRFAGTDVWRGQISTQGNSIVNGVLQDGRAFHMAWGDAIDTVPGTRVQDPVVIARPVICYGWFFVVCE